MKKKIKIKFVGFWDGFDYHRNITYLLLNDLYDVTISDNPDYIFCSSFGNMYEYLKYDQPRIFIGYEDYIPNLNLVDYVISWYPLKLFDRCYFERACIKPYPESLEICNAHLITEDELLQKTHFCNFVCGHDSDNNERSSFFNKLSEYKKVESIGSFLNNTGIYVNRKDGSKLQYTKKFKFSIVFESFIQKGYFTEKIGEAFAAKTIPIFYGSDDVKEIYNDDCYINVSDYKSYDDVIKKIIEIDNDDFLFYKMLTTPKFKNPNIVDDVINGEIKFLKNIFDQDINKAFRRCRTGLTRYAENELKRRLWPKNASQKSSFIKKCCKKINVFLRIKK